MSPRCGSSFVANHMSWAFVRRRTSPIVQKAAHCHCLVHYIVTVLQQINVTMMTDRFSVDDNGRGGHSDENRSVRPRSASHPSRGMTVSNGTVRRSLNMSRTSSCREHIAWRNKLHRWSRRRHSFRPRLDWWDVSAWTDQWPLTSGQSSQSLHDGYCLLHQLLPARRNSSHHLRRRQRDRKLTQNRKAKSDFVVQIAYRPTSQGLILATF